MRALVGPLAIPLALGLCVASCTKEGSEKKPPAPKASGSTSAARGVPAPPASLAKRPEPPRCRVITTRLIAGSPPDAGIDARAPVMGKAFDGEEWVDLAEHTEVVIRHAETTRELALRGPGRFLPCFLGTETVLVANGSIKTTAGAGARAGAEVILATALGALHFSDAALELRVGPHELDVTVETGIVALVPTESGRAGPDAGSGDLAIGPKGKKKLAGAPSTKDLIVACATSSRPLRSAPPPIPAGSPSARAILGQWSVDQLRARQSARWACASARAAIGREDGPERHRLWDQITSLDPVWQAAQSLGLDAGK